MTTILTVLEGYAERLRASGLSPSASAEKLDRFLRENRRGLLNPMWEELGRAKHKCLICGQIVESKSYRGNNNFGRVSHSKKHRNTGEAWSYYENDTDPWIMPTFEQIEAELQTRKRQGEIEKILPQLRAARKPIVTELKRLRKEREGYEAILQAAVRRYGREAPERDSTFREYCAEVQSRTNDIEYQTAELRAVEAQYEEDVVGQLTLGDGY